MDKSGSFHATIHLDLDGMARENSVVPEGATSVQAHVDVHWSSYSGGGNSWSGWYPGGSDEERLIETMVWIDEDGNPIRPVTDEEFETVEGLVQDGLYDYEFDADSYVEDGPDEDYYRD